MKPVKHRHLCEKHAKEYDPETLQKKTAVKENNSVCSCPKCDSLECFVIRNKHCACKQKNTCQPSTLIINDSNKINCEPTCSIKDIKLPETDSALKEQKNNEITHEYDSDNYNVKNIVRKVTKYSYRCLSQSNNRDNTDDMVQRLSTEKLTTRSGTITYSRQIINPNTATQIHKLSAQIMNVPYKDFKESISYLAKSEDASPKPSILSSSVILKRIKEAYQACSCKVCECLTGKSENPLDYCTCKPCECDDCKTLLSKIGEMVTGNDKNPHICPCIRCDRKSECKSIVKQGPAPYCDCDLYDRLNSTVSFTQPCNCQPCECIECKSYSENKPRKNNTVVVASMREDPRAFCQCSPCECAECGQDYSMGSSLRREMGTGINRPVNCSCDTCGNQSCETHDSNSCTCDVQKRLMRKPIEKDTCDYDIHRALVKKNVAERKNEKHNDTVAMFVATGNRFPQFDVKKTNSCSCGDCECIVCSCKDNTKDTETHKRLIYRNSCKCAPCECVICENKDNIFLGRKYTCECAICDCLKCEGGSQPSSSNDACHTNSIQSKSIIFSNTCKCSPCECHDCQKIRSKRVGDNCYCSICECQMCNDQTTFINETVYGNRNDFPLLSSPYGNTIGDSYNINQIKSKQNLSTYNDSSSIYGLNNPIRKSTQVLISKNSKKQKGNQNISPSDDYAECKENVLLQSYCSAPECDSSRSFMSDNSSLGLTCRISNIQPNLSSVMENENLSKSPQSNILLKFSVSNNFDDYTNLSSDTNSSHINEDNFKPIQCFNTTNDTKNLNINNLGEPYCNIYCSSSSMKYKVPIVDDRPPRSITKTSTTFLALSKTHVFTEQNQETQNVLASMRNANERLSVLMKPRKSNYSKLGPSKADISLPKTSTLRKHITYDTDKIPLENSYHHHTEDLSDIEIDQIRHTLQQAKAFSMELIKVLKDYKEANRKLVSKPLRGARKNIYRKTDSYGIYNTNNIDTDELYNSHVKSKTVVEGIDQKPFSVAYEPVKKYGSHNLNVLSTKEEILDTKGHQIAKKYYGIKSVPDEESSNVTHDVDGMNTYTNIIQQQDIKENDSKLSDDNILLNEPNSTINTQIDVDLEEQGEPQDSYSQRNECSTHKSSSDDKTLKSIESNKCSISRSVEEYKGALANLACNGSNSGIRQNDLVPQSENKKKAIITDKTTQHDVHVVHKPETTSTSTDAGSRYETSRFNQPVQALQRLETCSVLKKNCLLDPPYLQMKGISLLPPSFLDVKDTLRALSMQNGEAGRSEANDLVTVAGHGNRPLSKLDLDSKDDNIATAQTCDMTNNVEQAAILQRQARELLKMTAVRDPVVKKYSKITNIGNPSGTSVKSELIFTKCSCDALRVKFLGLRKVSDHTVFVKWKAPRDVTTVQGFELLVDGRAVEKILSPTRCMAVVTCLPHIEKVLITIRTLVADAVEHTHYPSTTIVYRTRGQL